MRRKLVGALRLFGLGVLAVLFALIAYGATYEHTMRRRAASTFPVRGRLVNVDGERRMQIDCRGAGSPTVVLESGLDNLGSLSWMAVHDSLAHATRVCAYSRAGTMWSDRSLEPFSSHAAARDLRRALAAASESAPWIMVGHSIGGTYVLRFAADYPREIAGLVLVDPSHALQFDAFRAVTGKSREPPTTMVRVGALLDWTGVLRLLPPQRLPHWPAAVSDAAAAYLPTSLAAVGREADAVRATLRDAREIRDLGDRPLVVLSATATQSDAALASMGLTRAQGEQLLQEQHRLHADLATFSCRGHQRLVPRSTHYVQFDRPDAVIDAIREVVLESRARPSLERVGAHCALP